MDETQTDVQTDTSPSVEPSGDAASSAVTETSVESQASVTGTEEQAAQPETQESDDPLAGLPSLDELKQQAEQKVPYAAGLANVVQAYEALKGKYEPLKNWETVAQSIPDPTTVQSNQELLSLLYSPSQTGDPNDYSTAPFLERLEQDSPGSIDKMYRDLTGMAVEINGQRDTLTRHMVRSWGLNPDNLEKYKQLENGTLPVATGIVNSEQLAAIPSDYHEAFKAMSQAQRDDILEQRRINNGELPLAAIESLNDKKEALEARAFREQFQQEKEAERRKQEAETAQRIETESQQAIDQLTSEVYDSIRQNLAQVKVSTDELENELHVGKQMALLYTAIDPAGRKMILDPLLAKLGVSLDSSVAGMQVKFDDVVNSIATKTAEAIKWQHYGDVRQANAAKVEATRNRQILTAKLSQIAMKLASPAKSNGNGNGATARQVPNGNGMQQQGSQNPYEANPHPFGTQEYAAFNRQIDRQLAAVHS